jgi:hypothetical protein
MYLELNKSDLAKTFVSNLLYTNRGFSFYVNWNNAECYKQFIIELNAMNCLIKNNNFDNQFRSLLQMLPSVVATFPLLFALSKGERESFWNGNDKLVIVNSQMEHEDDMSFSFNIERLKGNLTNTEIEQYLFFVEQIGIKHLLLNLAEKSLIDYVIGVLVGLDSNGRKNRGGTSFEDACKPLILSVCVPLGINVITQKQFKVLREYGFQIDEDIENRKADFILVKGNKAINIEVNFYNGVGSKPEEIIDSYINRQSDLDTNGIIFSLITDGKCWQNEDKNQLVKGFRHLNYLMNYNLAKNGMLKEMVDRIF